MEEFLLYTLLQIFRLKIGLRSQMTTIIFTDYWKYWLTQANKDKNDNINISIGPEFIIVNEN